MALAIFGIVAKVVLVEWVNHTSHWTVGTTLSGMTVVMGLLIAVLAVVDFGRSRGHSVPLIAFILGLLTLAPVVGYAT